MYFGEQLLFFFPVRWGEDGWGGGGFHGDVDFLLLTECVCLNLALTFRSIMHK